MVLGVLHHMFVTFFRHWMISLNLRKTNGPNMWLIPRGSLHKQKGAKNLFGYPSANEFFRSREMREIDSRKPSGDHLNTIPMISLYYDLPVIVLKSVELSERTLRFENSKVSAIQKEPITPQGSLQFVGN